MATCLYCGKPAGLFRKFHNHCREQHQNAVAMIPTFFTKILTSPLSAERFSELLREVAKASFITPDDLKSLFESGIQTIINEVLKTRLLTSNEEERILALKKSFGLTSADILDSEDRMIKVAILRDINEGRKEDRIEIASALPFDLQVNETVFWIFNRVACYQTNLRRDNGAKTLDLTAPAYIPINAADMPFRPRKIDVSEGSGDLIVTSLNIYFLSKEKMIKTSLNTVNKLHTYADCIKVVYGGPENAARAFVLDDPWFAANLVFRLARRTPGRQKRNAETSLPSPSASP